MEENLNMEDVLGSDAAMPGRHQRGTVSEMEIVAFTDDAVLVDAGKKTEGVIPKDEFPEEKLAALKIGERIAVLVFDAGNDMTAPRLSYRRARVTSAWNAVSAKKERNEPVRGTITRRVKGGYAVDLNGLEALLPMSLADIRPVMRPEELIGHTCDFAIAQMERHKNNVVLSRRQLLDEELGRQIAAFAERVKPGDRAQGTMLAYTRFGAVIDLNGIEALLHERDASWDKKARIKDLMAPGDAVEVLVAGIDEKARKVTVTRKGLLPHPWDGIEERFPLGTIVEGRVSSITNFGAFVELETGVEGLVHASEYSWTDKNPHMQKYAKPGETLRVQVIGIDRAKEKCSLSVKRLDTNPWEEAARVCPPGTRVRGKVSHLAPFGAFVTLPGGIEGLVHVADLAWVQRVRHPRERLSIGQGVEAIVLEIDAAHEKIALGIKQLSQSPFKRYARGKAVPAKVERLAPYGAFVSLEPGVEAFLHVSEIYKEDAGPKDKLAHPKDALALKQEIMVKVIKTNADERKIEVSMKRYEKDHEAEQMRKYMNKSGRLTLGDLFERE